MRSEELGLLSHYSGFRFVIFQEYKYNTTYKIGILPFSVLNTGPSRRKL